MATEIASRLRSKGSRFTLGVWVELCSPDVAQRPQPSATGRNRSQLFATVCNRSREGRMAVPMGSFAKGSTFGGFSVA